MIELRTIGSLEVARSGEGDVSAQLTQPKRLALLVYLATARPRGFHRRDTLLALFWPELDSQHAAGALSQALRHLREVLGPDVVVTRGRGEVGIDPAGLWCDAVAFETKAAQGDAEGALALYRGDFLQGVHISGLVEFERWMDGERASLRDTAARLAWMLAEGEERGGHAAAAGYWARRAAALTPNDEVAVRRQIALLHRIGDRAGAVAVYDEFARRFEADYGVAPSAETQAFIQEVRARAAERRRGEEAPGFPHGGTPEPPSLPSGRPAAFDHVNDVAVGAPLANGATREAASPERGVLAPDDATSASSGARLSPAGAETRTAAPTPRGSRLPAWGLAVLVTGMSVGAVVVARPWSQRQALPAWFDVVLPESAAPLAEFGGVGSIALSPDGSVIAYVGGSTKSLFLRAVDELVPQRLDRTEGAACPSFSPDGQWIAFISGSRLQKVAIRGGSPITVADSAAGCGVWTDHDQIVFTWRGSLYRVPASGGPVSLVTRMDVGKRIGVMVPSHALPGGNTVLVCASEDVMAKWQVALVTLPGGQITRLTAGGFPRCPARFADGHVLFIQNRTIVAAPFSLRALRFTGPEVALVRDTAASFSTAGNGTLTYLAMAPQTHGLVAVSQGGRMRILGGSAGEARLRGSPPMPLDTGRYSWPRLSPDGRRVVLEMLTAGHRGVPPGDLWVYDIPSRTLSRLTTNLSGIQPLGWTADGRNVVFTQIQRGNIAGPRRIVSQPWDGSGPARQVIRFPERFSRSINTLFDISIGRRHRSVAFVVENFTDTADIWIAPLDAPNAARPLVATRAKEFQPRLSPDERLLTYTSDETGRFEVYIRSASGPSTRLQVSTHGGQQPLWSPDGRELFYRALGPFHQDPRIAEGFMMRATIAAGAELSVVRRDTLFRDVFALQDVVNYDVFPGGKELLMIRPNPPGPAHAAVVLNWPELLRRRAAAR